MNKSALHRYSDIHDYPLFPEVIMATITPDTGICPLRGVTTSQAYCYQNQQQETFEESI